MPKRQIGPVIFLTIASITAFFAASGLFLRSQYVAPIIMYHSVSDEVAPENRIHVSTPAFERQMRFLSRHRYNVILLDELAGLIKNKKKIPPRTVAITFDDGYMNNYTHAYPILKKYNFPAAVFVILDEIGRPQGDRLGWSQIKEMGRSGFITIGSHTLGAEPLVNYNSDAELRAQISGSRRVLEEALGGPVEFFSYPGGMFNPKIRQMAIDAGYKAAVATNPGKKFPNDDIFALKRLRISENAGNLFVFWAETSGFYNFMRENRHK